MSRKPAKYQRLTAFRVLALIQIVSRAQEAEVHVKNYALSDVREALDSHLRAELTRRRK